MKKAALVMGSDSDFPVVEKAISALRDFGIPYETFVLSAHRTPEEAMKLARGAEEDGFGVIICFAGMAAHLAGVFAANTVLPVIGVPVKSGLEGLDALLATVQMPGGIPVATVAVNGGKNGAILAAEILALSEPELTARLKEFRAENTRSVLEKNQVYHNKYSSN